MSRRKTSHRWIEPQDFRDLRRQAGLTRREAAEALDVTGRTIQNWETGGARIPWMAHRMLRILRGYALPGKVWEGWTIDGDTLYAPNGRHFTPGELQHIEQVFAMARLWRQTYARNAAKEVANKVLPFPVLDSGHGGAATIAARPLKTDWRCLLNEPATDNAGAQHAGIAPQGQARMSAPVRKPKRLPNQSIYTPPEGAKPLYGEKLGWGQCVVPVSSVAREWGVSSRRIRIMLATGRLAGRQLENGYWEVFYPYRYVFGTRGPALQRQRNQPEKPPKKPERMPVW